MRPSTGRLTGNEKTGRRRRLTAAVALLGSALAAVLPATGGQAATPVSGRVAEAVPAAKVTWEICEPVDRPSYECGSAVVPLDYDDPDGETERISLVREPASDQEHKLGTLYVNPGGPGGSGADLVLRYGYRLDRLLGGRYDIVGFDPRGVGSGGLWCQTDFNDADDVLAPWTFPFTPEEEVAQKGYDDRLAELCRQNARPIINHMSTADVARDLEAMRLAEGLPKLNFLGYSYGSQIGTTYANMFPGSVGRMVLDGIVDPVGWTSGTPATRNQPVTTRVGSDKGSQFGLDMFLSRCDEAVEDDDPGTDCAFGPYAEQRFDKLAARLKREPIPGTGAGSSSTYADMIGSIQSSLYRLEAIEILDEYLLALEERAGSRISSARAGLARALGLDPVALAGPPQFEVLPGVMCTDSVNPTDYQAWPRAGAEADRRNGYFGRAWTWESSWCQAWPGTADDRYLGPWSVRTATPVMLVGNPLDPVTPHASARKVNHLLGGSRLLTYNGWGHTAFGTGSECVDAAVRAYLNDGVLPARGAACPARANPFAVEEAGELRATSSTSRLPVPGLPSSARSALAD